MRWRGWDCAFGGGCWRRPSTFVFFRMLKWLSGNSSSGASNNGNYDNLTHVGKVYTINRHQVVVEEVIAEGMSI